MQKFGTCEFTVNDIVYYTPRESEVQTDLYEVIEVLPNKDGSYEDRPFIENYWIRNINSKVEYLVYHSELSKK